MCFNDTFCFSVGNFLIWRLYIKEAHKMSQIYSDLHQTIQDKFNEAGIEIMSPHYMAVRDGNATTTPKNDLSKSNTADTASQSNKSE